MRSFQLLKETCKRKADQNLTNRPIKIVRKEFFTNTTTL